MNSRQLKLLSFTAVVVVFAAVWIGLAGKSDTQNMEQNVALYPALHGQLAKIQTVNIYGAGDQLRATLIHSNDHWTLKQRDGYAADTKKINGLLLSLDNAKLREEKTSNPNNYATIGIQDLTITGATGTRVELVGPEPKINLIVGKSDPTTRASYVRRVGETKSWLVSELTVAGDTASWLHHDLLNISADRIQEVAVQVTGSPRYSVVKAKPTDANFDVTPLPKKRELNSVSAANAVAQALTNLQLDDVRRIADFASNKSIVQSTFNTFDGLSIEVTGYAVEGKQWLTVKASVDEERAKRFATPPETTAKIRVESDALSKQLGNWAFSVESYKYDAIFKPLEQLLRKP